MSRGLLDGGDREVESYHLARSFETWRGVVLCVSSKGAASAKAGLDDILEEHGHPPAFVKRNLVYASGPYDPKTIADIMAYAQKQRYDVTVVEPGNPKTSYLELVGDWVGKVSPDKLRK